MLNLLKKGGSVPRSAPELTRPTERTCWGNKILPQKPALREKGKTYGPGWLGSVVARVPKGEKMKAAV